MALCLLRERRFVVIYFVNVVILVVGVEVWGYGVGEGAGSSFDSL